MRQPRGDSLTDAVINKEEEDKENQMIKRKKRLPAWVDGTQVLPLSLALVLGVVVGQAVEDEDLTPLCALVEGR